jgi:hypothetical protein
LPLLPSRRLRQSDFNPLALVIQDTDVGLWVRARKATLGRNAVGSAELNGLVPGGVPPAPNPSPIRRETLARPARVFLCASLDETFPRAGILVEFRTTERLKTEVCAFTPKGVLNPGVAHLHRPPCTGSMRQQNGQGGICQDVTGCAAKYHLSQSALRVGALDQKVATQ